MPARELIGRLPKAELHTHLDSSLRPSTMIELARTIGFTLPATDPEALKEWNLKLEERVTEQVAQLKGMDQLKRFFAPECVFILGMRTEK